VNGGAAHSAEHISKATATMAAASRGNTELQLERAGSTSYPQFCGGGWRRSARRRRTNSSQPAMPAVAVRGWSREETKLPRPRGERNVCELQQRMRYGRSGKGEAQPVPPSA